MQVLHFKPNNIPFPQTIQVCDIQYLVENLGEKKKKTQIESAGQNGPVTEIISKEKNIDLNLIRHVINVARFSQKDLL